MARSLLLSALLGLALIAGASAASSAPAHGKGKAKVAPVCSASSSAWKSTSSCNAFQEGICDTVASDDCLDGGGLCSALDDGCDLVTGSELDAYTTPLILEIATTYDGANCKQEFVYASSPEAEAQITYSCFTETLPDGSTYQVSYIFCPDGYRSFQGACANLVTPTYDLYWYNAYSYARCNAKIAIGETPRINQEILCMKVGSTGVGASAAAAGVPSLQTIPAKP